MKKWNAVCIVVPSQDVKQADQFLAEKYGLRKKRLFERREKYHSYIVRTVFNRFSELGANHISISYDPRESEVLEIRS